MLAGWDVVYLGNLCGSLLMVALLCLAGFASLGGGAVGDAIMSVATAKCSLSLANIFVRGILCNFLVCLAVWMGFAGRTVTDKFLAVLMPVTAFVACGFEHCVANMMLLPLGLLCVSTGSVDISASLSMGAVVGNIAMATIGNIIGGAILFAGAYWLALGGE